MKDVNMTEETELTIVATADGNAEKVVRALVTESGSDKHPRAFGEWQTDEEDRCFCRGTIGEETVVVYVGEAPDRKRCLSLQDPEHRTAKPFRATSSTTAVIGDDIPENRVAGLASQLASYASNGSFGAAAGTGTRKRGQRHHVPADIEMRTMG